MQPKNATVRSFLTEYVPAVLVALLIIVFAFLNEQTFLKTLPTLVTLVVQIMMVHANRYGFLVGGCNAALYGIGYLTEGLYFSASSAILFSFPMQIWSFFHWRKHSDGQRVSLRLMKPWVTVCTVLGMLAAWWACLQFLSPLFQDATYPALDAYSFVSGIVVTVLMTFRFVEAQYLSLIAGGVLVVMWILIVLQRPSNVNFLIISIYNLILTIKACVSWTRLYCGQPKKKLSSEV